MDIDPMLLPPVIRASMYSQLTLTKEVSLKCPQADYIKMMENHDGGLICPMDGVAMTFGREMTDYVLRHHELFSSAVDMPLGKVLYESGDVAVTKAAVDPVWHLPGIAARFGVTPEYVRDMRATGLTLGSADDAKGLAATPDTVAITVNPGTVTTVAFTKPVSLHAVTRTGIVVFFMTVPVYAISYAFRDSSVSFGCGWPLIGSSLPTARTTSGNGMG